MYLFKKKDGSLVPAPEDFDQQNPGWEEMMDVNEVLFVSKILVPQIKLVPKPSEPKKLQDRKDDPPAKEAEAKPRQTKKK